MQHLVGRTPQAVQQPGTRWQLASVRAACAWLQKCALSSVSRLLRRCQISLKRSRDYLRSPDEHYVAKLTDITTTLAQVAASKGRLVLVFLDEFSFYRQPTASVDWCRVGATTQPLARRSHRSDTCGRIVGALNALTGKVTTRVTSKMTIPQLVQFWSDLRTQYPTAEKIYVVLDNWPVHFHPDVLAALEPQATRWARKTPSNWPTQPSAKAKRLNLPLQLLPLPTYASWCNPIEKFWRKLQQEVLHLHREADDWQALREKILLFLKQHETASQELLRYVGLTNNAKLFGAVFAPNASPT